MKFGMAEATRTIHQSRQALSTERVGDCSAEKSRVNALAGNRSKRKEHRSEPRSRGRRRAGRSKAQP